MTYVTPDPGNNRSHPCFSRSTRCGRFLPRDLPKLRDRLAAFYLSPDELPASLSITQIRDHLADSLDRARLYWIDNSFTDLAEHAASQMPAVNVSKDLAPCDDGLLIWTRLATPRQITAVSWSIRNDMIQAVAYRASIRQRYRDLDEQRQSAETALAELIANQPAPTDGIPELLDRMPHTTLPLSAVPAALQRRLFETLHLTIRIDSPRRAYVSITLTNDTPDAAAGVVADIDADTGEDSGTTQSTGGITPSGPVPRRPAVGMCCSPG